MGTKQPHEEIMSNEDSAHAKLKTLLDFSRWIFRAKWTLSIPICYCFLFLPILCVHTHKRIWDGFGHPTCVRFYQIYSKPLPHICNTKRPIRTVATYYFCNVISPNIMHANAFTWRCIAHVYVQYVPTNSLVSVRTLFVSCSRNHHQGIVGLFHRNARRTSVMRFHRERRVLN